MTEMPLTPEIIEPRDGNSRRSSLTPELTGRKDGSLRGSSMTPELIEHEDGSGEKILPHYLRASTGSCHDFCKYGRHHAFAAKEKQSLRKGNKTRLSEGQRQLESVKPQTRTKKPAVKLVSCDEPGSQSRDAPEIEKHEIEIVEQKPSSQQGIRTMSTEGQTRKKKPAVKSVSSSDPETQSSDSQEIEKQDSEIVKQKPLSSDMKGNRTTLSEGQHQIKSAAESRRTKPAVKLVSSHVLGTQSYDTPESGKRETNVVKRKSSSPDRKENKTTPSKGQSQIKSSTPQTRRNKPAVKLASSYDRGAQSCDTPEVEKKETKVVQRKAMSPVKKTANVAKSSFALKPKNLTVKSPSSMSPKNRSGRRDTDVKTGKNSDTSKIVQKKHQVPQKPFVNRTTRLNARKDRLVKEVYPPKEESQAQKEEPELPNDEIVSEKTLYVIETKSERKGMEDRSLLSLSSPSMSSSSAPSLPLDEEEYTESEYEETETDSASDETEGQDQLETSKEEYKRRPRRAAMVHPEDNDPGHKLKFRRGKVVDLQSETTEPRRLRFRKGRLLGDNIQNGKGEGRRKSLRKREVGDGGKTGEAESGKVVLRHQDVNGKKDAQGLFNNVIEETASKLAETRLSKVKALVGAFETVISLQESNKASATTSG